MWSAIAKWAVKVAIWAVGHQDVIKAVAADAIKVYGEGADVVKQIKSS